MSPLKKPQNDFQTPPRDPENQHREFPSGASELPQGFDRREFLRLLAASMALAGVTACTRQPTERILPYIREPEELIPGKPLYYATALPLGGYARGVLVETHEGRPTKIEGNPDHPASLGAADVYMQGELLTLYDPDRSQGVIHNGQTAVWEGLQGELAEASVIWNEKKGSGLRLLTRHETSPTFLDQIQNFLTRYPSAHWFEYEPVAVSPNGVQYHLDRADVILCIEADFLSCGPSNLADARQFSLKRRLPEMNRLYVIESTPSLTGAMADHRILMNPEQIQTFARELAAGQGSRTVNAILADLRRAGGKSLVLAGNTQPDIVQELVYRVNSALGNLGVTVDYLPPAEGLGGAHSKSSGQGLSELVREIKEGEVETLIILGGNPAYDAPADFEFGRLLEEIPRTIHLGEYRNETAVLCKWHLPETHSLESWGDASAFDGTVTIMQPVIAPLFGGISRYEFMAELVGGPPTSSYEVVHLYWQARNGGANFDQLWRDSLQKGIVPNTTRQPRAGSSASSPHFGEQHRAKLEKQGGLHLLIRPSWQLYDGRFSNNAWLQEFPDPITKLVWDNAALISPATASHFQLETGDRVRLKFQGRSVTAPVWILPGQADGCVTIHLGYGRTQCGTVGNEVGFNAYALRASHFLWGGPGLEIEKLASKVDGGASGLVTTQHHWKMEGRGQVRVGTLDQFNSDSKGIVRKEEAPPAQVDSLYSNYRYDSPAWGMVIDLNTCIGCGACTIACQAENNIPTVGKDQVAVNREMHWIRVDRYYEGDLANPSVFHQPIPCMHCETAPCEVVCPVAATVHNTEGLNQMVYNRCIGTRYCSNNCPYKVRRFNFLEYDADAFEKPETRKLMRNPNVTVRSRGVMEKCTYCIQRISAVRIESRKANRPIQDGEIIPACAQTCPADAIIFGDIADPASRVARMKASPLNYGLLAELNTRPRTTYLAKLRNPNPELEAHEHAG